MTSNASATAGEAIPGASPLLARICRHGALDSTWTLLLLFGAAGLLRAVMLAAPIQGDEAYTYLHYVARPLGIAVGKYDLPNNHLFHTLCAWVTVRVFGLSAVSLRLPVFLFGLALVPLVYRLGKEVSGRETGLWAAALCGGCHHLVQYSANARGYGMQATLYVAALLLVVRLDARPRLLVALQLALALALALFTVPTLVFGAGSVFLFGGWLALNGARPRSPRILWLVGSAVFTAILTLLFYLPALLFLREHSLHFPGRHPYGTLPDYFASLFSYMDRGLPSGFAVGILVAVALGIGVDLFARRTPLALAWLIWPAGTLCAHYLLSERSPFTRNFIFALPLLFILASHGLATTSRRLLHRRSVLARVLVPCVGLLLFSIGAVHSLTMQRALLADPFMNTRPPFEYAMRVLRPGDHVALDGYLGTCWAFYAAVGGVRLRDAGRGSWKLQVLQRLAPDAAASRPLSRAGQHMYLLEARDANRAALQRWLKRERRRSGYRFEPRWQVGGDATKSPPQLFEVLRSSLPK